MTGDRNGQGERRDRRVDLASVNFDDRGLVPVVAQDAGTGEVLMLAYANREALSRTLETGQAHYFSRSRDELWRKGASSGNLQQVQEVAIDCDGDSLLYLVEQAGPACHTGNRSCFFRSLPAPAGAPPGSRSEQGRSLRLGESFALLESVIARRLDELPEGSYVAGLHERGLGYMAQKVVEEAGETVVAALERRDEELLAEAADLVFHLAVLLKESGHGLGSVAEVLRQRHTGGAQG